MQRFQAKIIAEENFLARKVSKKVSRILKECPDIGTVIEKQWRIQKVMQTRALDGHYLASYRGGL